MTNTNKRPKLATGAILYEGPSQLDGAPIVVIATGLWGPKASANAKTGAMIQTWILRADMLPMEAIKSGQDSSICGDCVHRGNGNGKGRSCYVLAVQAPTSIYRAYQRGRYARITLQQMARAFANRKVRLGSYGDPAAAPEEVWQAVLASASHWTGYTHQASLVPSMRGYLMASADTLEGAQALQANGWRTFRVMTDKQSKPVVETLCPASDESPAAIRADTKGAARPSCETCGLCKGSGLQARSVAIYVHGTPGANAARNVARKLATVS